MEDPVVAPEKTKIWTPPAAKVDKGLRLECMKVAATLWTKEDPAGGMLDSFKKDVMALEAFVLGADDAK